MANSLISPTVIARESLMQVRNNLVMGQNVHRQYRQEFVKIGESVTIRKPVKFVASDGAVRSNQDVTESSTSITIDKRKHVSWPFSTQSLTLTVTEYSERYMQPAGIVLSNIVDVDLAGEGSDSFWISGGTPGTTPATFAALGTQAQYLDDVAVPDDGNRKLMLNPAARWTMADALKGIYDNSLPRDLVRRGLLGQMANFEIYGDQNIARHTVGDIGDNTALVNDTVVSGDAVISMDDFSSNPADVHEGDVFTIAGVNAVNPVSKADLGYLQQFVVTADKAGTTAIADIAIAPAIVSSGPYQTVTALPADDASVTFIGSANTVYPHNLGFHKNALALVMIPLELPDSVNWKARVESEGISIRALKDYDIANDQEIIRMDIMYGVKAIYPELGSKLWG